MSAPGVNVMIASPLPDTIESIVGAAGKVAHAPPVPTKKANNNPIQRMCRKCVFKVIPFLVT